MIQNSRTWIHDKTIKCYIFGRQILKGQASMTDLYPVLEVTVTTYVYMRSSEKNYFDCLTHLISSLSVKINFHPPLFPYQSPGINTHMLLITNSNTFKSLFTQIQTSLFTQVLVKAIYFFLNSFFDKRITKESRLVDLEH